MLSKNILLIFIKYPQAGFVKSRLAESIGKGSATGLYKMFCETILANAHHKAFQRILFYSPKNKKSEIVVWLGRQMMVAQSGRHLGQKLSAAFKYAFKNGARRVVVVGTDSPLITNRIILKAFKVLERKLCVIGPSLDGGYYLIGLSKYRDDIFKGINWSTSKVLSQTLDKLKRSRVDHEFLEKSFDVDDKASLLLLRQAVCKLRTNNAALLALKKYFQKY